MQFCVKTTTVFILPLKVTGLDMTLNNFQVPFFGLEFYQLGQNPLSQELSGMAILQETGLDPPLTVLP